ncbi:unnamed protein product, partial [Staurois parvus]
GPIYRLSSCCCQACNLANGPPYRSPQACCQGLSRNLPSAPVVPAFLSGSQSRVCHGSLYGAPHQLLLSLSPHSAMCHFQVLLTLLWFSIFIIGCMASPLLLPSYATLWLHTLVLAP